MEVFDKNGLYLATKKIGKNNPKAEQIKENNEVRIKKRLTGTMPANLIETEIKGRDNRPTKE